MRLRKIKLAGFKSFVDSTTVDVPSTLLGIVGPNGCGKSNIIDAVRWVMGELSAKHLRGESMADVVFSGSNSRKPVGQASVELVFDNSEGRLGGQYAAYSEISVRRVVTREAAQSHYYLNGSRCRRRDVTDVFMGTGLGPRSYAIIEQGMISRLIEAKPDELREFLEEAAGISKYKERRRETENRIGHAHENLERLRDIREELEKRLQHLKRQAAMAEKYKVLKVEERLLKAQLLALRWRGLDEQVKDDARGVDEQQNVLEAAVAEQRQLESNLEKQRVGQTAANEVFNTTYRRVLDAGADIARVEESIAHLRSRQTELRENLAREQRALDEARSHLAGEQAELEELTGALDHEQPELERLQQAEVGSKEEFGRIEQSMREVQSSWETLTQQAARPAEVIHAETARIAHLDGHIEQLACRIAKLELEFGTLRPDELETAIGPLNDEVEAQVETLAGVESSLQAKQSRIEQLRALVEQNAVDTHRAQEQRQALGGQLASLERLQQEVLGHRSESVAVWLQRHDLDSAPRLAEEIDVESGWERAVETVLGFHLKSVRVDSLNSVGPDLLHFDDGALSLLEHTDHPPANAGQTAISASRLSSKVRAPVAVHTLLTQVFAVDSLEEALVARGSLGPGESSISGDGVWVGSNWMRVARNAVDGQGVLSRGQEIKTLQHDMNSAQATIEQIQLAREESTRELQAEEEAAAQLRNSFAVQNHQFAETRAKLGASQTALEQARERASVIRDEITELRNLEVNERAQLGESRQQLADAEVQSGQFNVRKQEQAARRQAQLETLEVAREQWQTVRDDVYEVGVRAESMRTKLDALRSAVSRNLQQTATLEARTAELKASLEATLRPLEEAAAELESKLSGRRCVETELETARKSVEAVEEKLRTLEQQRGAIEKNVNDERSTLEQLRVQAQETRVRRTTLEEQLNESGHAIEQALANVPDEATADSCEEQVEKMERRITRLGPINLAAIDEYDSQAERKQYLDSQHDDLVEALETLRQAIQKIDRETRTRFKDTYERVNAGLLEAFPRLFGGGTAFLEMTGDDLLNTGITMVARPPGKRNTSIHLLSGGEKALCAIALVFSIFELNPAPFCLLDEVDAPLDDANVGRFCELVKSMTDRVQFIVVTHSKITMEMTHQLLGVTMSEPGISRLVAVDVDEAAELAVV